MLSLPAYPRDRWWIALTVVTAILGIGIAFGYGIPVVNRMVDISRAQTAAANTADANRFWHMVAGDTPTDRSDLGKVATATRRLATAPDPMSAFRDYVAPGELPDIGDRLGFHAYERPNPNDSNATLTDAGYFTDRFVLHAIQATGAVRGGSVDDLMRPIPAVPDPGLLRWEWGAGALGGVLLFSGVMGMWLRRDRRRWPAKARAQALAALTEDERNVYRIIERLERVAPSAQRKELLNQAKGLFRDMQRGLATDDKLDALRAALAEAAETWQVKREVYEELTGKPDGRKERG